MSRTLQCANVHTIGNAHSHNTQESRTTACESGQQNSLRALASAVIGRTLPRTLPAQSEQAARTLPAQNTSECADNMQSLSSGRNTVSRWWLIHHSEREQVEIASFPDASHSEILERHPDAIAAQPLLQGAPAPITACSTCAHATYRGGCGEPVMAGLSDEMGVIRYHIDQGATCPAWLGSIATDLEQRIQAMTERWNCSGDDLVLALTGARSDPDGWRKVVESDEITGEQ